MYLLAALKAHNLGGAPVDSLKADRTNGKAWPLGPNNLLLISVGTGSYAFNVTPSWLRIYEAVQALSSMIHDNEQLALTQLQALSAPRLAWTVDREIGDLSGELIAGQAQLSFQRYDMPLEAEWLKGKSQNSIQPGNQLKKEIADQGLTDEIIDERITGFQELINLDYMDTLGRLAKAAGLDQVDAADFRNAFDNIWESNGMG